MAVMPTSSYQCTNHILMIKSRDLYLWCTIQTHFIIAQMCMQNRRSKVSSLVTSLVIVHYGLLLKGLNLLENNGLSPWSFGATGVTVLYVGFSLFVHSHKCSEHRYFVLSLAIHCPYKEPWTSSLRLNVRSDDVWAENYEMCKNNSKVRLTWSG